MEGFEGLGSCRVGWYSMIVPILSLLTEECRGTTGGSIDAVQVNSLQARTCMLQAQRPCCQRSQSSMQRLPISDFCTHCTKAWCVSIYDGVRVMCTWIGGEVGCEEVLHTRLGCALQTRCCKQEMATFASQDTRNARIDMQGMLDMQASHCN